MIPEDLERFLKEEKWFYAPDDRSIRMDVLVWGVGRRLKENGHIGAWNTSKVTNMNGLFMSQTVVEISDITRPVVSFLSFNEPLEAWDVSNVTSMRRMFSHNTSFNQPLGQWDVSSVNDMEGMFCGATSFNQSLEAWDVSNVQNMTCMFKDADSMEAIPKSWKKQSSYNNSVFRERSCGSNCVIS